MAERITRDDIVQVALGLLERGGIHALVMRRIATELGVQQSALYWHVENKQRLLAEVADALLAPLAPGAQRSWEARVIGLAGELRRILLRYPDGAELVATSYAFRLGARRPFELLVAELTVAGLAPADADVAATVVLHFVLGFATDEQQRDQAAALGAIDEADAGDGLPPDERFERGLHLIVTGIAPGVAAPRRRR